MTARKVVMLKDRERVLTLNIDWAKKQAKRLKKERGITHAEALREIAKTLGFRHWDDLMDKMKGKTA